MLEHLKNDLNYTNTENGALTHKSSHSHLLDFFSLAGAVRTRSEKDIVSMFSKAFNENPDYAMKALFFMRDVREGNGERRLFRICTQWLAANEPHSIIRNLRHIAEYGRWDDVVALVESPVKNDVLTTIMDQLVNDLQNMKDSRPISLLGKWLSSENASSPDTKRKAKILRKQFGYTPKEYRQILTTLRKEINVLERTMSAKQWYEVDYSKVPSQAMMKYRTAFYRNDEERYRAYLEALNAPVEVNAKSVKINTKTLYPYQIVEKAMGSYNTEQEMQLYNAMWENLPDVVGDNYQDSIAVIDVSGSMHGQPMHVAISLGLYIAEKNKGAYHNHFLTFSHNPQLVEVIGSNIVDKVRNIERANWGYNTDLAKTFKLILDSAIKRSLSQSDMPKTLYIISDMEFDSACESNKTTLFTSMKAKFAAHGYKLPRVVFWNVDARHNQAPVLKDEPNVQLVSGFSHNLFAALMEQREYNPSDFMLDVLNKERYKIISA